MPPVWKPRSEPLSPTAVAATGDAAGALARRLLARDDRALHDLRGVAGASDALLLVLGDDLPWVDGALYLAPAPDAPHLLVPTTHAPETPEALLERALRRRFPAADGPIALLPPARVVPLADAAPLDRAALARHFPEPPA